eukprot:gene12049-biopygen3856
MRIALRRLAASFRGLVTVPYRLRLPCPVPEPPRRQRVAAVLDALPGVRRVRPPLLPAPRTYSVRRVLIAKISAKLLTSKHITLRVVGALRAVDWAAPRPLIGHRRRAPALVIQEMRHGDLAGASRQSKTAIPQLRPGVQAPGCRRRARVRGGPHAELPAAEAGAEVVNQAKVDNLAGPGAGPVRHDAVREVVHRVGERLDALHRGHQPHDRRV